MPGPPLVDAQSAEARNTRGRELINQGKYREAIAELSAALRQDPNFTLALNARGFAYYLLRDYAHALADFDAAIRLNPKYVNAYLNRSKARRAAGDDAGSLGDIYFARLDSEGRVLPPDEVKTPGRSGMRSGLVALSGADGSTLDSASPSAK